MAKADNTQHVFSELGIHKTILQQLTKKGFQHPTPIQFQSIPAAIEGEDIVGIAQTGSGKTLAFSIPLIQNVLQSKRIGLILLPTRELAVQVEEEIRKISAALHLRTALVIGGTNPRPQIKRLQSNPHIIIATPGRLIDHAESKHIDLSRVGFLVLDEADRMLDMGFEPQLQRILSTISDNRQTMLFSATMPKEIKAIAHTYMHRPIQVEVAAPGTTADKIDQEMYLVAKEEKTPLLQRLLKQYGGTVLVFSRTKHGAKKLARDIRRMGHTADEIHSNRSQAQRQKALKGFSSGKYRILVATDIAARGIDVSNIQLVVNYDIPDQLDDYVHRIGRTGRAGKDGKAISFATGKQKRDIAAIQKLIGKTIPLFAFTGEELPPIKDTQTARDTRTRKERQGDRRKRTRRSGKRSGSFRQGDGQRRSENSYSKNGGDSRRRSQKRSGGFKEKSRSATSTHPSQRKNRS